MRHALLTSFIFFFLVNASAQSFTYDNANRLTQINYVNGLSISYSYDKLGNRISQTINASPLPLVLNSFSASADHCEANINWLSGSQEGIQLFALERSSDGNSFKQIAEIAVHTIGTYQYNDVNEGSRYYYYRLRIINKDGSYLYSQVVSVFTDCGNANQFSVFPNPATETVNVKFTAVHAGVFQIALINVQGQVLSLQTVNGKQGENISQCSLKGLLPGVYYIRLLDEQTTLAVGKVMKE